MHILFLIFLTFGFSADALKVPSEYSTIQVGINRAEDGKIYILNWSRFLDEKTHSKVVQNITKVKCQ